jgi:hypothetical protein
LVIEAIRRSFIHYGLWFHNAVDRLGLETASELEAEVGDSWLKSLDQRLLKALGFNGLKGALEGLGQKRLEALIEVIPLSWLAQDGLWFQAIEAPFGMKTAKGLNDACMGVFSPYEALRIKRRLGLSQEPGLEGLKLALAHRLYSRINRFSVEQADGAIVYRVQTCRVQEARRRKGLEDYPCKSAGMAEYPTFASMIDKRIKTACVACPPEPHPEDFWCAWRFELKESTP